MAVYAPGDRGKQVNGTGHNNGQGPAATIREARFISWRCHTSRRPFAGM
ncbi:hypothetical protein K8Q80_24835 [Escherichia coli]